MSELKGMKIYMAVDPQEDGSFFIKKSIRDGSLAVFDEERDAVSQVEINTDNTELREGFILSDTRKEKIESEIERLTAIATKHATRADELYAFVEKVANAKIETHEISGPYGGIDEWSFICDSYKQLAQDLIEKSRKEAEE